MTFSQNETLSKAISKYGTDMQLTVAVEELSELIKEICKHKRGDNNIANITEEMADVYVVLRELEIIFNNANAVDYIIDKKILRLAKMDLEE